MPHNLFGERFVSARSPAWHKLGKVLDKPVSALEAWKLAGPYGVQLENLIAAQSRTPTKQQAIVRLPCKDDPKHRILGTVSDAYSLITPDQFCELWDRCTGAQIETIGALGYGETFFVSTKLPSFKIRGEALDNYLLGISPMSGQQAAQVRVTPVRVVCQNTLIAAQRDSVETHRVVHTQDAVEQLAYWFKEVWEDREAKTEALQEAFLALCDARLDENAVNGLLFSTYLDPPKPAVDGMPPVKAAKRLERWEQALQSIKQDRIRVKSLYEGEGQGSKTDPAKGTAWGFYNAVVEYEDYGRKSSAPGSSLFGLGAKTKERAFQESLAIPRK